jgi:ATP-dependent Clp protease ATP-binding subunit ClpA
LFGKLVHGGRVTIDLDENEKIKLSFEEPASTPPVTSAI